MLRDIQDCNGMKTRLLLLFILGTGLLVSLLPFSALAQETASLVLTLSPGSYSHDVTAGKDNLFSLNIRNNGEITVTDIRLSASAPEGWTVRFTPDSIGSLIAGSSQWVDVNIRPSGTVAKGYYYDGLSITAAANEVVVVKAVQVNVEKGVFWMWLGGGVGVVVISAFVFVYIRFDKQRS